MSHRSDELAGGIARQLRVGVEGDDKLDGRQDRSVADDLGKAFAGPAAEQGVELRQLAPLAFVTHPQAFDRVPAARPMEQEEDVRPVGLVFGVEHFDACPRPPEQRLRLPAGSPPARPGNRSAKRNKDAGPGSPDNESPKFRPGERPPPELVSMVGTTTMVRHSGAMPAE